MANTYKLIASNTVGSGGVASVTFSSISTAFTDLKVYCSTRNTTSGNAFYIKPNGSTSNITNIRLYASGTSTASYSGTDLFAYMNRSTYTASTFDNTEIYFPNYRSANFKPISVDNTTETNASATEMALMSALWSDTSAITSLEFAPTSGTFAEHTTFYLYGIKNS